MCMICNKSSSIQCFCCPNAVCYNCIDKIHFVQVKTKSGGFCGNCLKLSLLIEENADVDSEGERVNFEDTETSEFLFKEYWEIVKETEKISLKDLQIAKVSMDSGRPFTIEFASDRCSNDEEFSLHNELSRNSFQSKITKSSQSKKRNFVDWGSDELINFLTSIGKSTSEPYTQMDTCEIIKRYIHDNALLDPVKKKKKVVCDEKLFSLFRKKTVKLFKIHDLLEGHFAANEDFDDHHRLEVDAFEDEVRFMNGKKKNKTSGGKRVTLERKNHDSSEPPKPPKTCYASVIKQNIKLVYLRKSLIQDFLKNPNVFEKKVVGSFVRVKADSKDIFRSPEKRYEIGQVASINTAKEAYKIGAISTNVVLCVSSIWKDVHISMLSEDDFEEEECEHLQQLVKKGLHPRLLITDLEKKASDLHQDITIHWIDREIAKVQKQIERANEKGWRREYFELIEKEKLLRNPAERKKMLCAIPEVVPDDELDSFGSQIATDGGTEKKMETAAKCTERNTEFCIIPTHKSSDDCEERIQGQQDTSGVSHKHTQPLGDKEAILYEKAEEEKQAESMNIKQCTYTPSPTLDMDFASEAEQVKGSRPSEIQVIDVEDDEDEKDDSTSGPRGSDENAAQIHSNQGNDDNLDGWHYLDPAGNVQGPFNLDLLRFWQEEGYFNDAFKVWRHGQPRRKAILLLDALKLIS